MKYETPELTTLGPAINAFKGLPLPKNNDSLSETPTINEHSAAYADWE